MEGFRYCYNGVWVTPPTEGEAQGKVVVGDKYGRLTAQRFLGTTKERGKLWAWDCECGNRVYKMAASIRRGEVKSCGCLRDSVAALTHTTHGGSYSCEYSIWRGMLSRCGNPKHADYSKYGGSGIKVCDEWATFEQFLSDMGPRPSASHTIERKDVRLGYSKDNCLWLEKNRQTYNRSVNLKLKYNGEIKTLKEFSRDFGITFYLMKTLILSGYTVDEIADGCANKDAIKQWPRPKPGVGYKSPEEAFLKYEDTLTER